MKQQTTNTKRNAELPKRTLLRNKTPQDLRGYSFTIIRRSKQRLEKKTAAEDAYYKARVALISDLRRQLQFGTLVARAAPVEDNSVPGDWEYLKSANWVVLDFDMMDWQTLRGGGKTYKGAMIGRHEDN